MRRILSFLLVSLLVLDGAIVATGRYDLTVRAKAADPGISLPEQDIPGGTVRQISAEAGSFWLGYKDGLVRISGTPAVLSNCGNWRIDTYGGGDIVEFRIVQDGDADRVCVKTLRSEPLLHAQASAHQRTLYLVIINSDVVFAGRLNDLPALPLI